jgi:23S rRNA (cytosine1962-C5)-methyltransferase
LIIEIIMITTLSPEHWKDYELIDSGHFEKLERFGKYMLIRPEPQAVWNSSMEESEWEKHAHVKFIGKSPTSGYWKKLRSEMPDQWVVAYELEKETEIRFRLGLTSFKHVGLFPEQACNWHFIYKSVKELGKGGDVNVLNLFAYTGGASLAARAAGATVSHLDSIKQVVTWANENMKHSNQNDIRWVVEDAPKYVAREVKRGKKYQGIILDPPAFGHGPAGESWKLEQDIEPLLKNVALLADPQRFFLVLNTYSLGFSSYILENLFLQIFGNDYKYTFGELLLNDRFNKKLPLGVFIQAIKKHK